MRSHRIAFRLCGRFLLLVALSLVIAEVALAANAESRRPNILFAFADDWGRYASAYAKIEPGGPSDIVSTPNFDRIASEGVLFRNAFVNAPSCTPCRSSLLSGQYFWRTGRAAILQGAIWDGSIPSYPLLLNEAGYHIGHTYKVWSPGTPANAPYGAAEFAYNRHGSKFNSFSQRVSGAENIEQAKQSLLEEVRGNFRDFLAARKDDAPLCYWFGPTNCHRKWIQGSGAKLWGLNPDDLKGKMPSFLPDVHVVREDFADYLGEAMAFDAALGVLMEELDRIGELDNTLIAVSGDHGIPGFPNGKCNLYDFGAAVPLAIRWPGKAPAGRIVDDFVCLPDLAPTFLEVAGEKPLDVMTGRSLVSVLASEKSGQVDKSRDSVIVGRERHVAAARTGNLPYPQRAIRTKDFLYIRNFKPDRWPMGIGPGYGSPVASMPSVDALTNNTFAAFGDLDASPTKAWIATHPELEGGRFFNIAFGRRPEEELFDLRTDPHQAKNVAGEKDYEPIRQKLSARLMKVLQETGDPRVTGDGTTFDKPPFSGEWKSPQRKEAKPENVKR
jgi:N-sulfoglucosamine sulfohydrolase